MQPFSRRLRWRASAAAAVLMTSAMLAAAGLSTAVPTGAGPANGRAPGLLGAAALVAVGGWTARRRLYTLTDRGEQPAGLRAAKPRTGCRPILATGGIGRSEVVLTTAHRSTSPAAWGRRHWDGIALLLILTTVACFGLEKIGARTVAASSQLAPVTARGNHYMSGLCWSCVAIVAKPITSALRKSLSGCKEAVGHAEQVGVTSLLQGLVALAYCLWALPAGQTAWFPPIAFWVLMAVSSILNAIIRTCETRAYAVGELSLCAPFLAFDPVMQLTVGVVFAPLMRLLTGIKGEEGVLFTARHLFAVCSIAQGMLSLSYSSLTGKVASDSAEGRADLNDLKLPRGANLILLNCVLYSFTYRLDARACCIASSIFYFACCRILMAVTCLGSSLRRCKTTSGSVVDPGRLAPFLHPKVALRMLAVVLVDGFYMLSMYRAVSLISPVFVSAVKRGGGVLVAAVLGAVVFGEKLHDRWVALLTVAVGVTLLCL